MASETIFYTGLIIVGISALAAAVSLPVFFFTGNNLKKQLETDYGKPSKPSKKSEK